jgi:hypothetical protein
MFIRETLLMIASYSNKRVEFIHISSLFLHFNCHRIMMMNEKVLSLSPMYKGQYQMRLFLAQGLTNGDIRGYC